MPTNNNKPNPRKSGSQSAGRKTARPAISDTQSDEDKLPANFKMRLNPDDEKEGVVSKALRSHKKQGREASKFVKSLIYEFQTLHSWNGEDQPPELLLSAIARMQGYSFLSGAGELPSEQATSATVERQSTQKPPVNEEDMRSLLDEEDDFDFAD